MQEPYIVLRGSNGARSMTRSMSARPGATTVELCDGSALERLQREPGFIAAAPSMPIHGITTAVEPTPRRAATMIEATTIEWGVRAVGADTSPCDGSGVVVAV